MTPRFPPSDDDARQSALENSAVRVNTANLEELRAELRCVGTKMKAHLEDYADLLLAVRSDDMPEPTDDTDDAGTIKTAVNGEMRAIYSETARASSGGDDGRLCALYQTIELCREIAARTRSVGAAAQLRERARRTRGSLICYLRNSYADTAYSSLCRVVKNPRVTYAADFTTVCEEVYYGRADFCILPVENSSEGALSAFRALIAKYELHTAARCVVDRSEYDSAVFALLTKNMAYFGGGTDTYFEISFSPGADASLPDALLAASCFGLDAERVDTVRASSEYGGLAPSCDIAFRCGGADIDAFLCYLALSAPRSVPLGMYDLIK